MAILIAMKIFKCKYCNNEFTSRQRLAGHTAWCELGPTRENGIKRLEKVRANRRSEDELTEKSCKWCKKTLNVKSSVFQNHVRWCKENPKSKQYRKDLRVRWGERARSEESLNKMRESIREAHLRGAYKAAQLAAKGKPGHKVSSETKLLLSEKRKEWLSKNPDKHPWKNNDKFKSVPCEKLKEQLKDRGIIFEDEFTPLTDRAFSIDIAFPEHKIGIEINGEQHYERDGSLKEYYRERHRLIEEAGWMLLEIHYSKSYKEDLVQLIEEKISERCKSSVGQDII
jgi:hypothetical protein